MKINAVFSWLKPISDIAKRTTGGDEGQLFLANEAKRLMDPYVPADSLTLAHNVDAKVEDGQGVVHYKSPYAHFQYSGTIYVSPTTGSTYAKKKENKVPTSGRLIYSKFRHPLATSEWDKAMMTARKGDLIRAMEAYLKRRGRM